MEVARPREGYSGISFSDGLAVLRWLLDPRNPAPELIFLDIGLPKLDGYEVARSIKSKPAFASVPIIMLTRREGVIDQVLARLSGASDSVTKPFTTQTITTLVHHSIGMEATSCRECAMIKPTVYWQDILVSIPVGGSLVNLVRQRPERNWHLNQFHQISASPSHCYTTPLQSTLHQFHIHLCLTLYKHLSRILQILHPTLVVTVLTTLYQHFTERVPRPSLLKTHPTCAEHLERLLEMLRCLAASLLNR